MQYTTPVEPISPTSSYAEPLAKQSKSHAAEFLADAQVQRLQTLFEFEFQPEHISQLRES